MNSIGQNERGVCVSSHKHIVSILLTLDSNVKDVIRNLYYNRHSIDNHCALYEHVRSKQNEKGVLVTSHITDFA